MVAATRRRRAPGVFGRFTSAAAIQKSIRGSQFSGSDSDSDVRVEVNPILPPYRPYIATAVAKPGVPVSVEVTESQVIIADLFNGVADQYNKKADTPTRWLNIHFDIIPKLTRKQQNAVNVLAEAYKDSDGNKPDALAVICHEFRRLAYEALAETMKTVKVMHEPQSPPQLPPQNVSTTAAAPAPQAKVTSTASTTLSLRDAIHQNYRNCISRRNKCFMSRLFHQYKLNASDDLKDTIEHAVVHGGGNTFRAILASFPVGSRETVQDQLNYAKQHRTNSEVLRKVVQRLQTLYDKKVTHKPQHSALSF